MTRRPYIDLSRVPSGKQAQLQNLRFWVSTIWSPDSSVGLALGYGLDDREFESRQGAGNFPLHHRVQTGSGTHQTSYPMSTRGSFPGVKRPGREVDHSPSSAEVKNVWSYTSTPQYTFMVWCSVKEKEYLQLVRENEHVSPPPPTKLNERCGVTEPFIC
jgi:hypothetical protein